MHFCVHFCGCFCVLSSICSVFFFSGALVWFFVCFEMVSGMRCAVFEIFDLKVNYIYRYSFFSLQ